MPDCAPLFELEEIDLLTADATAALAIDLAPRLAPGDVLLLEGAVGAGKTHFSRALIQSIQLVPEDVPSPTFTLVQTYDTIHGPLWHADLYR
ncbi:MAG: tRNA (adenosine(37)-N6)-threonylcarbamoyltransferase complex ATPase subunit type 1 TsaE, partial [Pseudomonadota bacterium]